MITKIWILVILIGIILLTDILFKIFGFTKGVKTVNVTLIILAILFLVIGYILFNSLSAPSPKTTQLLANFFNYDTSLDYVDIQVSSLQQQSITLKSEENVYAVPISPLDTITAKIKSKYSTKVYTATTTFDNITSPNLYFSITGIFTQNAYFLIDVINLNNDTETLYTKDLNGNIIKFLDAPTGVTSTYFSIGQWVYSSSENSGIIVINSNVQSITIETNKTLSIDYNLTSGSLQFINKTKKNGVLQYRRPWVINDTFNDNVVQTIESGSLSNAQTVYVTQEWRLVDNNGNVLSTIHSISQEDISSGESIVLTNDSI